MLQVFFSLKYARELVHSFLKKEKVKWKIRPINGNKVVWWLLCGDLTSQ
jgi:hypothetical protein